MKPSLLAALIPATLLLAVHLARAEDRLWPTEAAGSRPPLTIVIHKGKQLLRLQEPDGWISEYRVCLGLNPRGTKRIVGDCKTPEGDYFVCLKNSDSKYGRFLGISYPAEKDAQEAFEAGIISKDRRDTIINGIRQNGKPPWDTELGGWIGIHGYPTELYRRLWVLLFYPKPHNWTDGCIAMWNFEIEDLFQRVPLGTPVKILP